MCIDVVKLMMGLDVIHVEVTVFAEIVITLHTLLSCLPFHALCA